MFKNTYRMSFNMDHFDAISVIIVSLNIRTKVEEFVDNTLVVEFKAREKDIEVLKTKLNKYGMTVT